jgi:hypothetical protein
MSAKEEQILYKTTEAEHLLMCTSLPGCFKVTQLSFCGILNDIVSSYTIRHQVVGSQMNDELKGTWIEGVIT